MIYDISADDYELAEAAFVACGISPNDSIAPALRMLRDECGWSLGKAKQVIDMIQASQEKPR